jgi:hypothetical protein
MRAAPPFDRSWRERSVEKQFVPRGPEAWDYLPDGPESMGYRVGAMVKEQILAVEQGDQRAGFFVDLGVGLAVTQACWLVARATSLAAFSSSEVLHGAIAVVFVVLAGKVRLRVKRARIAHILATAGASRVGPSPMEARERAAGRLERPGRVAVVWLVIAAIVATLAWSAQQRFARGDEVGVVEGSILAAGAVLVALLPIFGRRRGTDRPR